MFNVVLFVQSLAANWHVVELPHQLSSGESTKKHLPATMSGGIAIFDYDRDGPLDVFLVNGGELPSGRKTSPAHANRLLRNRGHLRFEDVTQKAGVGDAEYSFGASAADYDGDGWPDLLVTNLRGVSIYRNHGDGTFADITAESGIDNHGRWAVGAAIPHLEAAVSADHDLWLPLSRAYKATGRTPDADRALSEYKKRQAQN